MRINCEVRNGTIVVRPEGELDISTAPVFRQRLEDAFANEDSIMNMVLNCQELRFVDSTGLGVILGRYKTITQRGGSMVLTGVGQTVKKIFELSGLFRIMKLSESEEEALRALRG